jgi:murein DD-endopeptidase MepM/ murein hydrolase activator NlpD
LDVKKKESITVKYSYDSYIEALKRLKPIMPIKNATISTFNGQLANAPRKYRNGFHQGFDFYEGFCSVKIEKGTPVVAIGDGRIIRADTDYVEVEPKKRETLLQEAHNLSYTLDSTLDILRGRQIWVDHGHNIVSRYCHLSGIDSEIAKYVTKGEIIGFVGGTGTKSKVPHLHFEIRLGDDFLGKGKSPREIREIINYIFGTEKK